MKKLISPLIVLFILFGAVNLTYAQNKEKRDVNLEQKKGKEGMPKIKMDMPTTDKKSTEAAPATKGGVQSRGTGPYSCEVTVSNYTDYWVKVYIDGNYSGTVGPYDDLYITTGNGYTTLYAVTTGGTLWWTGSGDCEYDYTFNLK